MRLLKRKSGSKEYWYLQHSFRKKGKVVTKEKYLGEKIPEDIDKIKEAFKKEVKQDVYKKLEIIKKNFKAEWGKIPESARKRELKEISIAFTYNTNAIEGSTITLEETREIIQDKVAPNKSLRDIRETEAHSKVFLQMLEKKERLTHELLVKWHTEIFNETKPDIAGQYRDYLVSVGPYRAPDWQDVEKLMNELIEFVEESKKMNHVELAGRIHYRFVKIHPFGDGNGRVGRLITNYVLWYSGHPMLIIEKKGRKSYYKALTKDEEGFVSYFIRRYLAVHKKRYLGSS